MKKIIFGALVAWGNLSAIIYMGNMNYKFENPMIEAAIILVILAWMALGPYFVIRGAVERFN